MKTPDPKIFVGLAALSLLLGGYLVYAQYNAVTEKELAVEAVREEVRNAASLGKELDASNQHMAELSMKLAHLERGVQAYQYVPTLLKELEETGIANGVQVTGVRPAPVIKAAPDEKLLSKAYDELMIEVKGRGTYSSVHRFLMALQGFPKIVSADTITIQPVTGAPMPTGMSPQLDVTLQLKAFIFPVTDATAATDSSAVANTEVINNG